MVIIALLLECWKQSANLARLHRMCGSGAELSRAGNSGGEKKRRARARGTARSRPCSAAAPAGRVSGPIFVGPESWASRGRWSGAETGLADAEVQAQGGCFCGQAVQNLCFVWVQ